MIKQLKSLFTLTLTLICVCTCALAVSASPVLAVQPDESNSPDMQVSSVPPQVIDLTPDISYEDIQPGDGSVEGDMSSTESNESAESAHSEESLAEEQQQPESRKTQNTPYFIGATIAVIVFVGVALYCKFNGGGMR